MTEKQDQEEVFEGEVMEEKASVQLVPTPPRNEALEIPNAENLRRLGIAFMKSGIFKVQNEFDAMVRIEYGREIGLPPVAAMQTLCLVKGHLCMEAKAMLALALKAGIKVKYLEKTPKICRIQFSKHGYESHVETFTIEDAKRAELTGKDNWQQYPEEMLTWRCMAKGLRVFDPGIILGLYSKEEILDIGKDFSNEETPKEQPQSQEKPREKPQEKPQEEQTEEPKAEGKAKRKPPPPPPQRKKAEPKEEPEPEAETQGEQEATPFDKKPATQEREESITAAEIKHRCEEEGWSLQTFKAWLLNEGQAKDRKFVDFNEYQKISLNAGDPEDQALVLQHWDDYVKKTYPEWAEETNGEK